MSFETSTVCVQRPKFRERRRLLQMQIFARLFAQNLSATRYVLEEERCNVNLYREAPERKSDPGHLNTPRSISRLEPAPLAPSSKEGVAPSKPSEHDCHGQIGIHRSSFAFVARHHSQSQIILLPWSDARYCRRRMGEDQKGFSAQFLAKDLSKIHQHIPHYDNKTEHLYSFLQVMTAITASFAHGANDVSNAVGPLSAIYQIWENGETPEEAVSSSEFSSTMISPSRSVSRLRIQPGT